MSEDLLRASTPQADPKPDEQGATDEGAEQAGKSSIQRLKERLSTSLNHTQYLQNQVNEKDQAFGELRREVDELKRQRNPSGPEDYSVAELRTLAFDEGTDEVTRAKAMEQVTNKRIDESLGKAIDKMEERLSSRFSQRDHQSNFSREYQNLEERYGRENLQPGSELHDMATQYYQFYKDDMGKAAEQVPVQNMLKLRAVESAARSLNLDASRAAGPPLDNIEGGSSGGTGTQSSDETWDKQYQELVSKGDSKGALAMRLQRYVYRD